MAISGLSLPIDIPWRRLCVSEDMLDTKFCDRRFPYRWRSSVAVFSYEPPNDQQQQEDIVVSYLKVVCTITGFQPDPDEVGLKDRRVETHWNDPAVIENYREIVTRYYGCYGAILEVALAPGSAQRTVPASQFPYFVDFEPKRRDLYEIVSQTGETMSRSLDEVNVRKGMTTADGREMVDLFGGVGVDFSYGGTGGGVNPKGEVGSRDMNQQEYANVRTTDAARELREIYSHTTQLSQLYHQLDSYHLGTNRAVFFMLPRPHVVQGAVTFVNGPRVMEGLQEFLLVVARPRQIERVCVEAYLNTAHVASEPKFAYEQDAAPLSLHVEARITDDPDCFNCYGDDGTSIDVEKSELYNPPAGWEIDLDRDGGSREASFAGANILSYGITEIDRTHALLKGSVRAQFIDRDWPTPNLFVDGRLDVTFTIYIRKKAADVVGYAQNLWLTGRGVCCCDGDDQDRSHLHESVTFETPLPTDIAALVGGSAKMTHADANSLRGEIGSVLRRSLNHPDRMAMGTSGFLDTAFLGRTVASLVRKPGHPDNGTLGTIPGLDEKLAARIGSVAPRISRGKLLEMPLNAIADRFGLAPEEAAKVRRASLGVSRAPVPRNERWDGPGAYGRSIVPDVVGLALQHAIEILREARLAPDHVDYEDSSSPRDTVLKQSPGAGGEADRRSDVRLTLSSGAAVQVPDIIGRSLMQAMSALQAAGLVADPIVHYVSEEPSSGVLHVDPPPRSFITPHQRVVLRLGGRSPSAK